MPRYDHLSFHLPLKGFVGLNIVGPWTPVDENMYDCLTCHIKTHRKPIDLRGFTALLLQALHPRLDTTFWDFWMQTETALFYFVLFCFFSLLAMPSTYAKAIFWWVYMLFMEYRVPQLYM
jgi:hypothetical protein